jgi:hypothetical protein
MPCGLFSRLLTAAALAAIPGLAQASVTIPPSTGPLTPNLHAMLSSGGPFVNPEVLLAFNPQPDPPGDNTVLDLTDHAAPMLLLPAVFGTYSLLVGMEGASSGDPYTFNVPTGGPTDKGGGVSEFTFTATGDGAHFEIVLDITGFSAGSWGAFNPQPDPPGFGITGFTFLADPMATMHIFELDANANLVPLSFTETSIPEPASLGVLLLAGSVTAAARRRRRGVA